MKGWMKRKEQGQEWEGKRLEQDLEAEPGQIVVSSMDVV
jgi:hypothetical protein